MKQNPATNNETSGLNTYIQEQVKILMTMTNSFTKLEGILIAHHEKMCSHHDKLEFIKMQVLDINNGMDLVIKRTDDIHEHIHPAK